MAGVGFKWTERRIQTALAYWFFDWRRQLVIPNISHGFAAGRRGECDLLVVSAAGYITEVEIKVSLHDLSKEVRKDKHASRPPSCPFGPMVKCYYIAAPKEIWKKANGIPLPLGAGRIAMYLDNQDTPRGEVLSTSAINKAARSVTDKERMELLRLAYFRLWRPGADMQIFDKEERG